MTDTKKVMNDKASGNKAFPPPILNQTLDIWDGISIKPQNKNTINTNNTLPIIPDKQAQSACIPTSKILMCFGQKILSFFVIFLW